MKVRIKNYFKRVFSGVSKWQLIYWWILRALMIYAFFDTAFFGSDYTASNPPIQILANLVGMFAYEIIQMFPEKNRFRFFSSTFQNITILGFFLGSFGGAYMNLYYTLPAYDKILHAFGTAEAVYIGYEYLCATQLKLKKPCPHQIINFGALGFGFILSSAWELFEFTYDQFFGGDAQHWSYQAALEAAGGDPDKIFQLIPMNDISRFALMDTMGDIILNFIGAFALFAFLSFYPYRHRGKNDINAKIEAMNKAEKEEVSVK
ncbi:MAG: hypothetical protein J1E34_10275 [Oscillospiraceae bacterium]|nr:hypothetical protein [Oscillospiraceae bacterium]